MAMKVVGITGERACALLEKPEPKIKNEFVKVRIVVAPMCTEYKSYLDGGKSDCLGHEAAGEVVEVARPGKVRVGDRVGDDSVIEISRVAVILQTPAGEQKRLELRLPARQAAGK